MDSPKPQLPIINPTDHTPLVDVLLELLAWQQKQIEALEQEILKLKGETTKPDIKPSKMDKTRLVVPPRENAVPWEKDHPRNAVLEQVAQRGMAEWKKESGYHRRSITENAMYRLKQLFGDSLASRLIETQVTEVHTRIAALNIMTYLGMPVSVRVPVQNQQSVC